MDRISASGNLTIEHNIDHWRLLSTSNGQERTLLEAETGKPVSYIEIFGSKRRLPKGGKLSLDDIQRVVLGWSHEDECWHLGFLVEPELAEQRGSRWCELARWPDPETTVFNETASEAGRALARTLQRPFNLIEPDRSAAIAAGTIRQESAPPAPLRSLPIQFDQWTLTRQSALQFVRGSQWARQHVIRLLWYALLVIAYFVLSIVTLTQVIALPKPEFLPYLGLVVGIFLIAMMLYTFYELINRPNRVVVDNNGVEGLRGKNTAWQVPKESIAAVYVSEVVNRKGKKRVIYHGEINIHLKDDSFRSILEQPHTVEDDHAAPTPVTDDTVIPLTLYNAQTDLQMAGLHVAQTLGIECLYDQRIK
ncbi:MAG: hypothetical protein ABI970_05035 [Chloroflexota bacterium]